jgi:hypothetical protein
MNAFVCRLPFTRWCDCIVMVLFEGAGGFAALSNAGSIEAGLDDFTERSALDGAIALISATSVNLPAPAQAAAVAS